MIHFPDAHNAFMHFFLQIFKQFFQHFVENQQQLNQVWFQQTFLYCLAWAYGSTLQSNLYFTSILLRSMVFKRSFFSLQMKSEKNWIIVYGKYYMDPLMNILNRNSLH